MSIRQNIPASPTGSGDSVIADLSPDGRWVAFLSNAPDLVSPRLEGGVAQLYLKDRLTGGLRLASTSPNGYPGDGPVTRAFFTADGQFLVFESRARNLGDNAVGGEGDVFRCDPGKGVVQLVSVRSDGKGGGNGRSWQAAASADGSRIAFASDATDLVSDDANGARDVFLRDLNDGTTALISANWRGGSSGTVPTDLHPSVPLSGAPTISADGRWVAFASRAGNLVPDVPGSSQNRQVYLHDLEQGRMRVVSVTPLGEPDLAGDSWDPLIAGGRVFFLSAGGAILAPPGYAARLLSVPLEGEAGQSPEVVGEVPKPDERAVLGFDASADGRQIVYHLSGAAESPAMLRWWNVDNRTDVPVSLGVGADSMQPHAGGFRISTTGDRLACLGSGKAVADDQALVDPLQVFVRDLPGEQTWLASFTPVGEPAREDAQRLALNRDGAVVAFDSGDEGLVAGDANRALDVFAWPVGAKSLSLISARDPAEPDSRTPGSPSGLETHAVSHGGRFVLFTSAADDLIVPDGNGTTDVFLQDREESVIIPLSFVVASGRTANHASFGPVMTADARWVAFYSWSTDLVDNDLNREMDVYLCDVAAGTTQLVSETLEGQAGGGVTSYHPLVMSPNGRYVAFLTTAGGYVRGTGDGNLRCLVRDVQARTTWNVPSNSSFWRWDNEMLALSDVGTALFPTGMPNMLGQDVHSFAAGGDQPQLLFSRVLWPQLATPGGRWLFHGARSLAEPGKWQSLWLADTVSGESLELMPQKRFQSAAVSPSMTPDGERIVFDSSSSLTWFDRNLFTTDVYCVDRDQPGTAILVSANPEGVAGNGDSRTPAISADGRFVAFQSYASDLVFGDENGAPDVFVRDLELGLTWLATGSWASGGTGNGGSYAPAISGDGSVVTFVSIADDLADLDHNGTFDLFAWHRPEVLEGDGDGDGLDDLWEVRHFGGLHRDGRQDADHDLLPDGFELRLGTDPFDAGSALRLAVELQPGGSVMLRWDGPADLAWRIEAKHRLDDVQWQRLPGAPEPTGEGGMRLFDDSFARSAQRFYRLAVDAW